MVKTNRLKHPYLWLQSFFNSSACNCFGGACNCFGGACNCFGGVCIIWKAHEAP